MAAVVMHKKTALVVASILLIPFSRRPRFTPPPRLSNPERSLMQHDCILQGARGLRVTGLSQWEQPPSSYSVTREVGALYTLYNTTKFLRVVYQCD